MDMEDILRGDGLNHTTLGKPSIKKNGEIWELFPIGWVGGRPDPNFLTGF